MPKLGWKKDKYDKRDYMLKAVGAVPDVVILNEFLPDVRDQGNVGSCVGFGVGANLVGAAKRTGTYTEWFSPTWIYNGARFIDGSLPYDDGCYPRDAMDWIRDNGCLLEHFWPYNPYALDKTSPSSSLKAEAQKFPIISYYRAAGVENICAAIAAGHFVSIGTPWFNKWMTTNAAGELASLTQFDSVAGGHETCLYGYDKVKQVFYGVNSWGTDWGNKGHYVMPFSSFDIFNLNGGYDAHYIQVNWAPVVPGPVPPTPVPDPVQPTPATDKKEPNKWLWIAIGIAILALIGLFLK
jgi:C1A family cysteine protease